MDISNNIHNILKAVREEQGLILVPALPSMLQPYLSSKEAGQAHDTPEMLQLHRW